jgi:hypothetical protein
MTFAFQQDVSGALDCDRSRALIVRATCIAWLASLLLSWRAYIPSARIFELSPLLEPLAAVPAGVDWVLLGLNAGCLIWLAARPLQRTPALASLACLAFWILQDLLRFQPYLYMYAATILLTVFFRSGGLNALRLMVGSVYFWAGFHKLNLTFCLQTFPWFVAPLYRFSDPASGLDHLAYAIVLIVPLFEAAIGLLLLFSPARWRLATLMAFCMLVVVLACLGPTGRDWNKVVWVWNIDLFLLEFVLFYRPAAAGGATRPRLRDAPALATVALFAVAPALALVGWWPSYAAFKLYSGNTETAEVMLAPDQDVALLPGHLGKLVDRASHRMGMDYWTAAELEMTAYPATYVFRRGAAGLCAYLGDRASAKLRVFEAPPFYTMDKAYQDYPLCPAQTDIAATTRSPARTE